MAWYRKHRPQTVAGLALAPIREQLENVLSTGKFAHAYLFAGPKGTGKTSSARILARILNDERNQEKLKAGKGPLVEPSDDDPLLRRIANGDAQVVIELDAASHRGIDDVRQLQEQVSVSPSEGWYRVVILDEVHMLTNEAFNALLKLLEEPPTHVIFILATTELHKVPATIQSRCQVVRFRQAKDDEVARVLNEIATNEKIELVARVIDRISAAAEGSFRDAVKYFELVVRDGKVDEALLEQIVGSQESVLALLRSLAQSDLAAVSAQLVELRSQGVNFASLEQSLMKALQQRLHRAIARKESASSIQRIAALMEHLVSRLGGPEPVEGIALELACISWCLASSGGRSGLVQNDPEQTGTSAACERDEEPPTVVQAVPSDGRVADAPALNTPLSGEAPSASQLKSQWSEFLLALRVKSQAVESIIRSFELLGIEGNTIQLQTALAFHKEQLQKPKYIQAVQEALEQVFGASLGIDIRVHQAARATTAEMPAGSEQDQLLAAVEAAVLSLG